MDLDRFITAQKDVYPHALSEIRKGRKTSHWMWFIFPQLKGLVQSSNAVYYGITDLAEATAYLRHPVLGPRLIEISRALLLLAVNNATTVMGSPDDLKLCSSMTLFAHVKQTEPVFSQVLEKYFHGKEDPRTIALLTQGRKAQRKLKYHTVLPQLWMTIAKRPAGVSSLHTVGAVITSNLQNPLRMSRRT